MSSAYQSLPSTQPARTAPLRFAHFRGVYDRWPKRRRLVLPVLAPQLLAHTPRAANDGPCYSPTCYPRGVPRGSRNVEALDALVLEFDGVTPDWGVLEGADVTYLAYSTFSHYVVDGRHPVAEPHYRLFIPLARPVSGAQWRPTYARARVLFPDADPACSDPARLQRYAACPLAPPAPPEVRWVETGRWLDVDSLPPLPPPRPVRRPAPTGGPLAATDWRGAAATFDARVRIVDLLLADGWTHLGDHGDCVHLGRPGKDYAVPDSRCSATANYLGNNRVHVFTSSAPPLEAGQTYGPFRYVATVHHGGDYARAAGELRRRGDLG